MYRGSQQVHNPRCILHYLTKRLLGSNKTCDISASVYSHAYFPKPSAGTATSSEYESHRFRAASLSPELKNETISVTWCNSRVLGSRDHYQRPTSL